MSQTQLKIVKTLIGQADDLAREHEEFNDRYIISGRKALYELLGKIYALAEQLDCCNDREDQVAILRKVLSEKYGIRTQENTSDTTVLVRYITQADRKTAHVYSRAIETARLNKVDSSEFAGYVEQAGGVERIRAGNATPPPTYQEVEAIETDRELRLELARKYLTARTELPLASFNMGKRYSQTPKTKIYKQFIGYERNGRYYVLAQQDVDDIQELKLVEQIAKGLNSNFKHAEKNINAFYSKAMLKRKQRTIKEISKKRPELAKKLIKFSNTELKGVCNVSI
jgi:exonuclease I